MNSKAPKRLSGSCRPWRTSAWSCPHQAAHAAFAGTSGRDRQTKSWTRAPRTRACQWSRTRACQCGLCQCDRSCRRGCGAHPRIRSPSHAIAGSTCPCSSRQQGHCPPTTPGAGKIIRRPRHGGFSPWPSCGLRLPGDVGTCSSRLPACCRRGQTSSKGRNGYQATWLTRSHLRKPCGAWPATAGTCRRLPRTSSCRCMAASTSPGISMYGRTCSGGLGVRRLRRPRRAAHRRPASSSKRRRLLTPAATSVAPRSACNVRCVLPSAPWARCGR